MYGDLGGFLTADDSAMDDAFRVSFLFGKRKIPNPSSSLPPNFPPQKLNFHYLIRIPPRPDVKTFAINQPHYSVVTSLSPPVLSSRASPTTTEHVGISLGDCESIRFGM